MHFKIKYDTQINNMRTNNIFCKLKHLYVLFNVHNNYNELLTGNFEIFHNFYKSPLIISNCVRVVCCNL